MNHIYVNGVRIAALKPDNTVRYYMTDQVDSVSLVLDGQGKPVSRFEYMPYGETWISEKDERLDETHNPKFNSQELDHESGFYYYNARYYDPEIARFVSPDSVIDGEYSPAGWNRYMYVKGNPVGYIDPTGHQSERSGLWALGDWLHEKFGSGSTYWKDEPGNSSNNHVSEKMQEAKDSESSRTQKRPQIPLSQGDPSINTQDKNMKRYGCHFRTLQNIAERITGKNLTAEEINQSRKDLQKGKNPAIRKDMYVNNGNRVINDALNRLGKPDLKARIGKPFSRGQKPSATLLRGEAIRIDGTPYLNNQNNPIKHSKSGDADGKERFNPSRNIKTVRDQVTPIYINNERSNKDED